MAHPFCMRTRRCLPAGATLHVASTVHMLLYFVCHKIISNNWSYTELLNQPTYVYVHFICQLQNLPSETLALGLHSTSFLLNMTGFWKIDRIVTLGQLHFLGPANSHTHTLSMHRCNTRLSCLICLSRVNFADHVKPRLRQWEPWRVLDGRYGSYIHPC